MVDLNSLSTRVRLDDIANIGEEKPDVPRFRLWAAPRRTDSPLAILHRFVDLWWAPSGPGRRSYVLIKSRSN